eukprot:SAG22_NODE_5189_length_1067_cov_1.452479_1_plen_111_part_00
MLPGQIPASDDSPTKDPEAVSPRVSFNSHIHYDSPPPPAVAPAGEHDAAAAAVDLEAGGTEPFVPESALVTETRDTAWKAGAKQQEQIDKQALESTDQVYVPLASGLQME